MTSPWLNQLPLLQRALARLCRGFDHLPPLDAPADAEADTALAAVLEAVAERLHDNFPYHHPLYAGQMLKPPHPVARLAYALALSLNPNNHALDGGRASSAMEKEAVAGLAAMVGFGEPFLGHLTGGGTMANLEALWVAREVTGGGRVLASKMAHYIHGRLCGLLGLPFSAVAVDPRGRMDPGALEQELLRGEVGTVVATVGTTATGALDPLPELLRLQQRHGFRLHLDAAYGGYYTLLRDGSLEAETRRSLDLLGRGDSLAIDPHKHGLQPYGCGCVLFSDPSVGRVYRHDSPYTYFSSDELHLGEISLECSRPGAAAVALWATGRLLPLTADGAFARDLGRCRAAALELHRRLQAEPGQLTAAPPELDIVVWAPAAPRASEISRRSRAVFEAAAAEELHLALAELPAALLRPFWPEVEFDRQGVVCLRSCLLKPEHLAWLPRIWHRLQRATATVR